MILVLLRWLSKYKISKCIIQRNKEIRLNGKHWILISLLELIMLLSITMCLRSWYDSFPILNSKYSLIEICINKWLSGLGVWFLLWVQEVPGSNPGWARQFFWKKKHSLKPVFRDIVTKLFHCGCHIRRESMHFINQINRIMKKLYPPYSKN